jgi:hypothetical protein
MKPIYLKPDQSLLFVPVKMKGHDEILDVTDYSVSPPSLYSERGFYVDYGDEVEVLKPPFHPGEVCYVREVWYCENENTAQDIMSRGQGIYYKSSEEHPEIFPYWRSPVTMPQWAARRFVTILSCEPMRVSEVTKADMVKVVIDASPRRWWEQKFPGKQWAWRVEVKEAERGPN